MSKSTLRGSQTNSMLLSIAREDREIDADNRLITLSILDGNFTGSIDRAPDNSISLSRRLKKGALVDLTADGGIQTNFYLTSFKELAPTFFFREFNGSYHDAVRKQDRQREWVSSNPADADVHENDLFFHDGKLLPAVAGSTDSATVFDGLSATYITPIYKVGRKLEEVSDEGIIDGSG